MENFKSHYVSVFGFWHYRKLSIPKQFGTFTHTRSGFAFRLYHRIQVFVLLEGMLQVRNKKFAVVQKKISKRIVAPKSSQSLMFTGLSVACLIPSIFSTNSCQRDFAITITPPNKMQVER